MGKKNASQDEFTLSYFVDEPIFSRTAQNLADYLKETIVAKYEDVQTSLDRLVAAGKIFKCGEVYGNRGYYELYAKQLLDERRKV